MPTPCVNQSAIAVSSPSGWKNQAINAAEFGDSLDDVVAVLLGVLSGESSSDPLYFGVRADGSTDTYNGKVAGALYQWVKLDPSTRIFEWTGNTGATIYPLAYAVAGEATFFTNGQSILPLSGYNSWVDVNYSSIAPSAVAVSTIYFENASTLKPAFRQNGSTNALEGNEFGGYMSWLAPCDGSQIGETFCMSAPDALVVNGYFTSGIHWNTNAAVFTATTTGWEVKAAQVDAAANGIIWWLRHTSGTMVSAGVRAGAADAAGTAMYNYTQGHTFAWSKYSGTAEVRLSNTTNGRAYVAGWTTPYSPNTGLNASCSMLLMGV